MEIVGREVVRRGERWDTVAHTLRNARGQTLRREFLDHPGAAAMLPILPDGRLVLIRNFRHVVPGTLLELPAGTRAPDESFEATARRELTEETGFVAGRIALLLDFYPSPGPTSELIRLFACWELVAGPARPEDDEEIAVVPMSLDEALARSRDGTIRDAKTLLGLWHAEHLRRRDGPDWLAALAATSDP